MTFTVLPDKMLSLEGIDPEYDYLSFAIDLRTDSNKEEIASVGRYIK
jgi:hypothetical protein